MSWGKSLTKEIVHEVEKSLPDFSIDHGVALSEAKDTFKTYLSTYGFDRLLAQYPECRYSLGNVQTKHYRLAVHAWQVPNAKGTVFVSHGLFDHVGLYLGLVEQLIQAKFSVVAMDFPGHGLSEGEPAVIKSFNDYADIIGELLDSVIGDFPMPIYAVGQSTGGAALLSYVLREKPIPLFEKLVLLAPLIQPQGWRKVKILYLMLNKILDFVPRGFTTNSHAPEFNEFLKHHDPLQPRHVSAVWTGAMKKWIEKFDERPASNLPCLVIQGDEDATVDWKANLPRIQSKFSNLQVEMIEGAMHHLVCEGDAWRSKVFEHTVNFLKH